MKDYKGRLLLADDDIEFLSLTLNTLAKAGFTVGMTMDGETVLRILDRQSFDALIINIKLPCIDGTVVFKKIRRLYPRLPLVLLANHETVQQSFMVATEGAFSYLSKSANAREITAICNMAIEQSTIIYRE